MVLLRKGIVCLLGLVRIVVRALRVRFFMRCSGVSCVVGVVAVESWRHMFEIV
jgi:hypothetical protein